MKLELTAADRYNLRKWLESDDSATVRKVMTFLAESWRERAATDGADHRFNQGTYYGIRAVELALQDASAPPPEVEEVPAAPTYRPPARHSTGGYI